MELGEIAYSVSFLQQGYTEEIASQRKFSTLVEVENLCERLNKAWQGQIVHWPVKYEAKIGKKGKPYWAEVKDANA